MHGQSGLEQPESRVASKVEIDGVVHYFGKKSAVRGVSLTVEQGEIVCLLGHSGCGKTTLLRILAGTERPQSGTIRLDQKVVVADDTFVPPEKREVGLMFQDFALFPHLTVLDNVRFGLSRLTPAEANREAREALERVGLAQTANDHPHMLSGGMQQRVALARAIVPKPRIILMDEPFSGLDRRTRDRVRDETLGILRELGTTTLVVTHDPDEALRIADRIVLMRDGRIVQDGSARDFYNQPVDAFAARFFHELNEFDAVAKGGKAHTPLGEIDAKAHADGTQLLVGIRHSAVELSDADEQSNGPRATVTAVQFLGEIDLVRLMFEGLDRPVFARSADIDRHKPGDKVGIRVHPEGAMVFQN
ncbi:MAG: ABC transporter ATP-binding protein [Pseudomonadota bacterium]